MTKICKKTNSDYPFLLREIYNPPDPLYCRGNMDLLGKTCVAVVGTRKNTDYGAEFCKRIVEDLSALDVVIVSGLAYGIDTIAHQAALKSGMATIAVLGCGIGRVYPESNLDLAMEIEQKGLIISEYPEVESPKAFHFVARNRIISGLSIATIVIEAPEKSGALITAKYALDQGREVFVLPGDADRQNFQGNLGLLQYGSAYPIKDGNDVIDVLKRQPFLFSEGETEKANNSDFMKNLNLDENEKKIFFALSKKRAMTIDNLIKKVGLPTNIVLSGLSILEIKGLVKSKQDKFKRKY